VTLGDAFVVTVPANWMRVPLGAAIGFAPEGAIREAPDATVSMTHGIQLALAPSLTGNLQSDLQLLLETLSRTGTGVRWRPSYAATRMAGRAGLTTTLSNVSPASGAFEQMVVYATHVGEGVWLYAIGIAPYEEWGTYRLAFDRIRESIQRIR
jgi:hypothetical protein